VTVGAHGSAGRRRTRPCVALTTTSSSSTLAVTITTAQGVLAEVEVTWLRFALGLTILFGVARLLG
jgi:hypothetical protein